MSLLKQKKENLVDLFSVNTETELNLPYVDSGISAGFPSPALDFIELSIDLNRHLIKNPSATFYGRVKGDSLKNAGIDNDDLLIIDRSIEPTTGKIAVCFIEGEFTAKRIQINKNEILLIPENDNYQTLNVTEDNDFLIWGVVTYVIKKI